MACCPCTQAWDTATGSVVLELGAKSVNKEAWPLLQWGAGDEAAFHGVTNTVHQYSRASGFKSEWLACAFQVLQGAPWAANVRTQARRLQHTPACKLKHCSSTPAADYAYQAAASTPTSVMLAQNHSS